MNEQDKIIDVELPENLQDALKVAKSLCYWIEYIEKNPLGIDDPMNSFGGHIDFHLATLKAWFAKEMIYANARLLKRDLDELKKTLPLEG